jgi:hypothetical protein
LTPTAHYLAAAVALMRARLEEIRTPEDRADVLNFAGRRRDLIGELNRCWDALTERTHVPKPAEVLAWL